MAQPLLIRRAPSSEPEAFMSESPKPGSLSAGGGWLVDEMLFRLLVDFEIQKAQRLRYSIALVCFAVDASPSANGSVSKALAESLSRHLRGTDAVASWARGWLSLLLVDADTIHLPSILRRITTHLEQGVWSAGGSCYPRTATRAEDMLRQAVDLMDKAKEEGGNRLYVAP
jgi:GGDEF domain-containing protein